MPNSIYKHINILILNYLFELQIMFKLKFN